MLYACNPSVWEAEAAGFRVPGQLGLHRYIEIPCLKKPKEMK
jgi:hypothetical protein